LLIYAIVTADDITDSEELTTYTFTHGFGSQSHMMNILEAPNDIR